MLQDIKCPECGSEMVVRTEKKGPNAGQRSRVCLNYPECKGKIPLAGQSDSIDIIKIQLQAFSTLWGHLLFQHNVGDLIETSFLGRQYIRFGRLLIVMISIFETGMILGRARRDKLRILVKTFPVLDGSEDKMIDHMQENARKRLDGFGEEPATLFDYIMSTELKGVNLNLTSSNPKIIKRVFMSKLPMNEAEAIITNLGIEGIGFGSYFPELTEKLWNNTYKFTDLDKWSAYRAWGLAISERPPNISLMEREQAVLRLVADFVEEHYPELIDPLDLRL